MNLVNINGIVTNKKKNKSKFLHLQCGGRGKNNILPITETWTKKDEHYDLEITSDFTNYSTHRMDRKKKELYSMDEHHLNGRGGCMLLASLGMT